MSDIFFQLFEKQREDADKQKGAEGQLNGQTKEAGGPTDTSKTMPNAEGTKRRDVGSLPLKGRDAASRFQEGGSRAKSILRQRDGGSVKMSRTNDLETSR